MGDQTNDWLCAGKKVQAGKVIKSKRRHEEKPGSDNRNVICHGLLTPEDVKLLEDLGVTIYDASGVGVLTPEEIANVQNQIKNARGSGSITGISNIELTMLDSCNRKYTRTGSGFCFHEKPVRASQKYHQEHLK